MKKCPFCGANIEKDARFCLYCMSSLDKKQTIESLKENKFWPYIILVITVLLFLCLVITQAFNYDKSVIENNSSFQSDYTQEESVQKTEQNTSSVTHNSSNDNVITENSTASTITSVSPSTSSNNSSNSSSSNPSESSTPQGNNDNDDEVLNPYIKYYISGNTATITSCNTEIEGDVVIPTKIKGYTVKTITSLAFSNCKKITSITVPEGITLYTGVFNGCTGLKKAEIGTLTDVSSSLFSYCTNLTEVTIKSGNIPKSAFIGCSKLSKVTIMNKISIIDENAFNNCNKLTDVFCASAFNEITIKDGNSALTNANWHIITVTSK